MRRIALCIAVAAAAGCSFDSGGHVGGDASAAGDATAPPDAGPACTSNADCATPPNACKLPGTCNLEQQVCEFPEVDCSSAGDECNAGVCDVASGACVKQPAFEGEGCGAVTECDPFSGCEFEPGDVCDETGSKTRDCMDYACSVGACVGTPRVDDEPCSRDTDGDSCGSTSCTGFGDCTDFSDTCDEGGTKYQDCVRYECAAGGCAEIAFIADEPCTRPSRDGLHCAPDDCGPFSACQFSPTNVCDETGIKTRTCTPFTCQSESCVDGTPYTDDGVPCTRDTSDVVCDTVCSGGPGGVSCVDVYCSGGECPGG